METVTVKVKDIVDTLVAEWEYGTREDYHRTRTAYMWILSNEQWKVIAAELKQRINQ